MRRLLQLVTVLASVVMPCGTARAVDIINEDDIVYDVAIEVAGKIDIVEIAPGGILKNVCGRCIVSVDDGEALEALGNQIIVIKNGGMRLDGAAG